MENSYKLKYLKYKEKYLNLKHDLEIINGGLGATAATSYSARMQRESAARARKEREREEREREER